MLLTKITCRTRTMAAAMFTAALRHQHRHIFVAGRGICGGAFTTGAFVRSQLTGGPTFCRLPTISTLGYNIPASKLFAASTTLTHHVSSHQLRSTSTDASASQGPTLQQTLSAAAYVRTQLDSIVNSASSGNAALQQQQEVLLDDLHSIASTLLDYGADDPAAQLFRYSLEEFDSNNVAVRERLSAALRNMGHLSESANELFRVICTLEDEAKEQFGAGDGETLALLYLDLGHLVEAIKPLPGSGWDWDITIEDEADAPRIRLEFDAGMEDDTITVMLDDDDDDADKEEEDGGGLRGEDLSAIECYRRAISYDADSGMAHKRLADALAIIGRNDEALQEFENAAELMPDDICCATHVHFGKRYDGAMRQDLGPLPMADAAAAACLEDLSWDPQGLNEDESALSSMAMAFERDGAIVFPSLLSPDGCKVLSDCVAAAVNSMEQVDNDGSDSVADFTDETRAASNRLHMALPLTDSSTSVISSLFGSLSPLLSVILQCSEGEGDDNGIPLLGSGFMRIHPGAEDQDLHKDVHHYDRHGPVEDMPEGSSVDNGSPRCVSIQVQLTDTTTDASEAGKTGSLEVLPGTHRPDAPNGQPSNIHKGIQNPKASNGVISIDVPPGTVTIYSSRLWHRGGPNESDSARTFCFFTAAEPDNLGPPGLIHTMERKDVGRWKISSSGLIDER